MSYNAKYTCGACGFVRNYLTPKLPTESAGHFCTRYLDWRELQLTSASFDESHLWRDGDVWLNTDSLRSFADQAHRDVEQIATRTRTPQITWGYHNPPPKETDMAWNYNSSSLNDFARESLTRFAQQKPATPEEAFRKLDVQPGDRVRLTEFATGLTFGNPRPAKKDGATLEGIVKAVKVKDGWSRLQIDGFAVNGNDVFWPVADYHVEVLHKAYRWTPEDEVIVAILGDSRRAWEERTEATREGLRLAYRPRLVKVRKALGLDDAVE